jgi:hypothetical protein
MNILFATLASSVVSALLPRIDAYGITKIQALTADAQKPSASAWVPARDEAEILALMGLLQLLNTAVQKLTPVVPVAASVVAAVPVTTVESNTSTVG